MDSLRRPRGALAVIAALFLATVGASPSVAARYEPVGVDVASFKTDYTKFEALDDARLGIIIDLVGAGVVDCLDNPRVLPPGLTADRSRSSSP